MYVKGESFWDFPVVFLGNTLEKSHFSNSSFDDASGESRGGSQYTQKQSKMECDVILENTKRSHFLL